MNSETQFHVSVMNARLKKVKSNVINLEKSATV